jgi:predicted Zn-dependent protease/TolB-like protein
VSECNDKDISKMLFAFELDLLSADDRARVEQHIIECDACFHELHHSLKSTRLIKFDHETREQIRTLTQEPVSTYKSLFSIKTLWPVLTPAIVIAVIVFMLILKDWHFDFSPNESVIASENRIAIFSFDNLVQPNDTTRLNDIVANLLITSLSQSTNLQVVSSQYLYDLRLKIQPADGQQNETVFRQVSQKANAHWLLSGAITQISPELVVTIQLIEVSTNTVKAAAKGSTSKDTSLFLMVDHLSHNIKQALLQPIDMSKEAGRPISEITTASIPAYQEYIRGLDLYRKFYFADAEPHFRKAVLFDSTFAIPYYYLANIAPNPERRTYLTNAMRYLDHASDRDRCFIQCQAAINAGQKEEAINLLNNLISRYPDEKEPLFQLSVNEYGVGRYLDAIKHLQASIALDSTYGQAYNQLAYTYEKLGDLDNAVWAIERYISSNPNDANPYDSKGEILARYGRVDEAIESNRRALQLKPDFYSSLSNLGMLYLFRQDYQQAESCFAAEGYSPLALNRGSARLGLCYLPVYQGQFNNALVLIDSMIHADSLDGTFESIQMKLWYKAIVFEAIGDLKNAAQTMEIAINLDDQYSKNLKMAYLVRLFANNGSLSQAHQWIERLKIASDSSQNNLFSYWIAEGSLALTEQKPDSAITLLKQIYEQSNTFFEGYLLSISYLESHRYKEAIRLLEELILSKTHNRQFWTPQSIELHYYLGKAYEGNSEPAKAIEQYQTLLSIWGKADQEITVIKDTKDRLNILKK